VPYHVVKAFHGVDTRRADFATDAASLVMGINVHLTRGADLEQRKAFAADATLPGETIGLTSVRDTLYTFGSGPTPAGMPVGYIYQRLEHPTGAALTDILDIDTFDGKLYVAAQFGAETLHYYDGVLVDDWYDGKARGRFAVAGGAAGGTVTSVKVDGVDILGAVVPWTTSRSNTAALIAAQITAYTSTPDFQANAISDGAEVVVVATTPGNVGTAGLALDVDATFDVSPIHGFVTGGTDGDTFTPGNSVCTLGEKMYATSGSNLHFSAIDEPMKWQTSETGAGFANLSTNSSGSEDLVGLELLYDNLVIFSPHAMQIWHVEADDSQNVRLQTFRNIGLVSPRAALVSEDGATAFLSRRGLKGIVTHTVSGRSSLAPQSEQIDSDPTPGAGDVGLIKHMNTVDPALLAKAIILTEPADGRLWVIVGERVFVHSAFSTAAGWTEYAPGFVIEDYAIASNRIYVRSGNTVYLYGGASGDEYDASPVTIRLPYIDNQAPATMKDFYGLGLGAEGTWNLSIAPDPKTFSDVQLVASGAGFTVDGPTIPCIGHSTHVSIELTRAEASRGRLSSVVLFYKNDESA
jgi:hypothetical protein